MNAALAHGSSHHARLVQSVLLYVATCLKNRDHRDFRELRLRPDQAARISNLSAADLVRLAELGSACVSLEIDPEGFDAALECLDRQRDRDALIERCIRRDAPRALMEAFFGLSRHRYSKLRAMLGMPAAAGRRPQPSAAIAQTIYERWTLAGQRWSARRLLEMAEDLDISLRTIWDQLGPLNERTAEKARRSG